MAPKMSSRNVLRHELRALGGMHSKDSQSPTLRAPDFRLICFRNASSSAETNTPRCFIPASISYARRHQTWAPPGSDSPLERLVALSRPRPRDATRNDPSHVGVLLARSAIFKYDTQRSRA